MIFICCVFFVSLKCGTKTVTRQTFWLHIFYCIYCNIVLEHNNISRLKRFFSFAAFVVVVVVDTIEIILRMSEVFSSTSNLEITGKCEVVCACALVTKSTQPKTYTNVLAKRREKKTIFFLFIQIECSTTNFECTLAVCCTDRFLWTIDSSVNVSMWLFYVHMYAYAFYVLIVTGIFSLHESIILAQ